MSTGVAVIDAQHRELVARYNRFQAALLEARGRTELLEALEFLLAYAKAHFPAEEALMSLHTCPTAEPNRLAHSEMQGALARVAADVRAGGVNLQSALEVESRMAAWLRTHLCTVDIKLRGTPVSRYFREKSA